tara:strand:+ start:253 stop:492 length:240 start_codon:yes stop_codon:yes gene_type:complete
MPAPQSDRWKCELINPLDMESILWEGIGKTLEDIAEKFQKENKNDYITKSRLSRATLGRCSPKNNLIRIYKLKDEQKTK